MKKQRLTAALFALVFLASPAMTARAQWVKLVVRLKPLPNAQAAINAGRQVLIQAYGAKNIAREEPLIAKREGNVWVISGTLNCPMSWWQKLMGGMCVGGTAEVKLSAKDGNLVQMTHSQ